jgi:hypothetical protein
MMTVSTNDGSSEATPLLVPLGSSSSTTYSDIVEVDHANDDIENSDGIFLPRKTRTSWAVMVSILAVVAIGSSWVMIVVNHHQDLSSDRSSTAAASSSSSFLMIPLLGSSKKQQHGDHSSKRQVQSQHNIAQKQGEKNFFSKIVVVVVNDQSDDTNNYKHRHNDDDDEYSHQDDDNNKNDKKNKHKKIVPPSKNSSHGKKEQEHESKYPSQEHPSKKSQLTTKEDKGEECEPKDWKCWMDKPTADEEVAEEHDDVNPPTEDDISTQDDGAANGSTTDAPCALEDWKCWANAGNTTGTLSSTGPGCAPADWKCWVKQSKTKGISTLTANFNIDDADSSTNTKESTITGTLDGQAEDVTPAWEMWPDRQEEEKIKTVNSKDIKSTKDLKNSKSTTAIETTSCDDGKYSKRTLKLAYELPFAAIFRDTKGQNIFEASSVTIVDGMAYAVCDSSWAVSMFDPHLVPFGEVNIQIGDPKRETDDSGYEAIFYDNSSFYIVRESIIHDSGAYHAQIEQVSLHPDVDKGTYDVVSVCPSEFEFDGASKGFEGAVPLHDVDGNLVVLGLCEGNHCSESKYLKSDKGNGRLVAMKQETMPDGSCRWSTIRMITIPPSAYFGDYSAIDISKDGRVVIGSQEESQVWIGYLDGMNDDGLWNIDAIEFRTSPDGKLYDFPKNDNCQNIYCNIEGVHWLNDETLIAVSDKMKGKGKCACYGQGRMGYVFHA